MLFFAPSGWLLILVGAAAAVAGMVANRRNAGKFSKYTRRLVPGVGIWPLYAWPSSLLPSPLSLTFTQSLPTATSKAHDFSNAPNRLARCSV